MDRFTISSMFEQLQDHICEKLEQIDGKALFSSDLWSRTEGGGGKTNTIRNGAILEKGGVAFSAVHGHVTDVMKKQLSLGGNQFFASGVSIVLHPYNPHIPIIHMNVRYFELDDGTYWFGGGIDLTPHYIVPNQAKSFHEGLKILCDRYHPDFYSKFKDWADDYFFISHRSETRGIGGIFFDHLNHEQTTLSKDQLFQFCLDLGEKFPELYAFQVKCGKDKTYTEEELKWRNLRRGRYVEFNLVHDRGTKFGLLSGGRVESILMSLPTDASWEYNFVPLEGSIEAETKSMLRKGINWLNDY